MLKPQVKTEIEVKPKESKSVVEKVNPALYKKLIIEDLTSTGVYYPQYINALKLI